MRAPSLQSRAETCGESLLRASRMRNDPQMSAGSSRPHGDRSTVSGARVLKLAARAVVRSPDRS
jgi:hypothetical protein